MFNPALLRAVVHIVAALGKSAEMDVDFGTATALTEIGLDSDARQWLTTASQKTKGNTV